MFYTYLCWYNAVCRFSLLVFLWFHVFSAKIVCSVPIHTHSHFNCVFLEQKQIYFMKYSLQRQQQKNTYHDIMNSLHEYVPLEFFSVKIIFHMKFKQSVEVLERKTLQSSSLLIRWTKWSFLMPKSKCNSRSVHQILWSTNHSKIAITSITYTYKDFSYQLLSKLIN